ncbi:LacI family DNA-binding transcriptional regulator [Gordonia phthalatica]|uniref:LacI family transcriptional regulator n=1 Tax=Gordonia phthalatica TaxID=1136941 RepID=A0A0N9ND33_9ACTN|nr:LacI family DNA-binding transcriptional regulator [Gordonia phthalatica]ALG83410.1 LacI family transcriptional regulator [Gordonia phthalatica]
MTDPSRRRAGRPPTMKEIAERAGVHVSTVSRVLRQSEPVDGWSEAAQRVREVADELGYRPNPWAASLRTRRTTTIGAVMPRLTDGVVATIYQGVEEAARAAGYSVLLSSPPDEPAEQRAAIELLAGRQVDGLILSSLHSPATDFVDDLSLSVPVVALNRHANSGLPFAGGDDRLGGRLAGEHLVDCGYRRIAAVGGPLFATTGADRLTGFLDAMRDAGMPVPDDRIAHARMDVQGGIDAARTLLDRDDRPDAVFCVSDTMAIGLLGVARDLGLTIPDDLGLVGYNDIPVAAQLPVPLTTIVTPAHRIGEAGVQLLLQLIAGTEVPADVRLPVELTERGSTRRRPRSETQPQ